MIGEGVHEIVVILNLKRKAVGTFVFRRMGWGGEAVGTRKILFKKKKTTTGPKPKASPKCALLQKRRGGPLVAKESANCPALGNYRKKEMSFTKHKVSPPKEEEILHNVRWASSNFFWKNSAKASQPMEATTSSEFFKRNFRHKFWPKS